MAQVPIPNDWDGETWTCILLDWPDSVGWLGLLRGLVSTPARGRWYDASTGVIADAQLVGLAIMERNEIMSCQEIVAALQAIQVAIEKIDISQEQQLTIQANINTTIQNTVTAVSSAIAAQSLDLVNVQVQTAIAQAQAFAWSNSYTELLQPITVINNYPQQLRPIDPPVSPPPTAEEETQTGVGSVVESTSPTEICKRVFWLVYFAREFFRYLHKYNDLVSTSVLGILGLVSDAVPAALIFKDTPARRYLLPIAALLQLTHTLAEMVAEGEYFQTIEALKDGLESDFTSLTTDLACSVENQDPTDALQDQIMGYVVSWQNTPNSIATMRLIFNLSVLATLYYVSPDLDTPPAIPPEFGNPCGSCE